MTSKCVCVDAVSIDNLFYLSESKCIFLSLFLPKVAEFIYSHGETKRLSSACCLILKKQFTV